MSNLPAIGEENVRRICRFLFVKLTLNDLKDSCRPDGWNKKKAN